jgi:citronellol/citronellal dehydrogenase
VKLDVRKDEDIENMVSSVIKKFGRIDILINNAGALWWKDVIDTPMKKYDLINQINARATFACTRFCG